ncbi:MAG: hypothetical protein AAFR61_30520 [Bacteroidota bacterium]
MHSHHFFRCLLLLPLLLLACQETSPPALSQPAQAVSLPVSSPSAASITPCGAEAYAAVRQHIREKRMALARQYQGAAASSRNSLLAQAMDSLVHSLVEKIFPCWYGTPWTFEGHTDQPGEGSIACGYFVSTTLKHIGFNLNRYRLAQQAALPIIRSLTQNVQRFRSPQACLDFVAAHPGELFILGQSYHVGFLYAAPEGVQFIHAGYFPPTRVCREAARTSDTFEQSEVWVVGSLNQHPELARKWLSGEKVSIITP